MGNLRKISGQCRLKLQRVLRLTKLHTPCTSSESLRGIMSSQNTAWKRPVSRIYHYNLEVGENYYNPMTSYIDNKATIGEAPGALSFSERLAKKWIRGRTEYKSSSVATCTTSYTKGF